MLWRCGGGTGWAGGRDGSRPRWDVRGRRSRCGCGVAAGGSRLVVLGAACSGAWRGGFVSGWRSTTGTRTWFGRSWSRLGVRVSLRTAQRAVEPFRRELRGGGGGADALRDAAGVSVADRFSRAPGVDRRGDEAGDAVRGDTRVFPSDACSGVLGGTAGALVRGVGAHVRGDWESSGDGVAGQRPGVGEASRCGDPGSGVPGSFPGLCEALEVPSAGLRAVCSAGVFRRSSRMHST